MASSLNWEWESIQLWRLQSFQHEEEDATAFVEAARRQPLVDFILPRRTNQFEVKIRHIEVKPLSQAKAYICLEYR